jgi:hypothetical protein
MVQALDCLILLSARPVTHTQEQGIELALAGDGMRRERRPPRDTATHDEGKT